MSPEDVRPEWVEKAAAVLRDSRLVNVCGDGRGCRCEEAVEYSLVSAHDMLAAVLPDIQAAAFDDFAARVRAQWAKDGERCPWVGALDDEAARLREGSTS
jgi:hypothetical protein